MKQELTVLYKLKKKKKKKKKHTGGGGGDKKIQKYGIVQLQQKTKMCVCVGGGGVIFVYIVLPNSQ